MFQSYFIHTQRIGSENCYLSGLQWKSITCISNVNLILIHRFNFTFNTNYLLINLYCYLNLCIHSSFVEIIPLHRNRIYNCNTYLLGVHVDEFEWVDSNQNVSNVCLKINKRNSETLFKMI